MNDRPVIVNYGGGTNSTALLVEAVTRGLRVDAAAFADTGGELPETYEYLWSFAGWLERHGIRLVALHAEFEGRPYTLEQHSLRLGKMPSVSYGRKSCSLRFKAEVVEKWARATFDGQMVRLLGYDADEPHRAGKMQDDARFAWSYPLIEWGMGREECAESIMRAGLPLPGKSSCFFCGSARPPEVDWLAEKHPDLFARGLAMEEAARPFRGRIKGLGKNFAWSDVAESRRLQTFLPIVKAVPDPCGCYEGARDADLSFAVDYCGSWEHDALPLCMEEGCSEVATDVEDDVDGWRRYCHEHHHVCCSSVKAWTGGMRDLGDFCSCGLHRDDLPPEWPTWTPRRKAPKTLDLFDGDR